MGGLLLAGEFSDLDCERCAAAGPATRAANGCEQPTAIPLYSEIPGVGDLHRCPLALLTVETGESMRLYGHYRKGRLLADGGLGNQPSTYLTAMEALEAAVDGSIERQRVEHEEKLRRKYGR